MHGIGVSRRLGQTCARTWESLGCLFPTIPLYFPSTMLAPNIVFWFFKSEILVWTEYLLYKHCLCLDLRLKDIKVGHSHCARPFFQFSTPFPNLSALFTLHSLHAIYKYCLEFTVVISGGVRFVRCLLGCTGSETKISNFD